MEEDLEEKVVQILTQVASGTGSREEKKSVLAKLRDGSVQQICKCGERLIGLRRYDLAYQEVFYRYCDRATQLRLEVERKDLGDTPSLKVSVLLRYLLGASYALYLQTIHRDDAVLRSDTVDVLRDALKDVLHVVEIFSAQSEAIREELYWCLYNSSLLAVRMCRWLRLHGFPQLCVQPLWLLVESMHTCLPLMAVHMIPFRSRVMLELAACAEAAKQLGEAARACVVAQEHIEKAKKLETMLPPVPAETTKLFEVQLCRFKLLKLKYDFWLKKVPDVNQLSVQVKEISPQPAVLVSGLLETLKFLHGLPQHFGAEDAKCGFLDGLEFSQKVEEGAPEVTKFTNVDVQAKQVELLTALVELIKPLAQKAEAATKDLEEHTVKRLTWEAEAEGRARTDEPKLDEKGEEVPPEPRPQRPNTETLEGMGFGQRMHSLEEVLPLDAHVWLVEECLRQEMRGKEAVKGFFEVLERSLALRLRYRHFLRPPLVDVDVLASPEAEPAQIRLPECYELLTGDLNFYSPSNDPAAMEKLDETGLGVAKQAGKHVYVIGQRFDAWENWTAEYPIPIRRLCNLKLAFVPRVPENVTGPPSNAVGVHEPRFVETDGEVKLPWLGAPYRAAGAGDSSGFEVFGESEQIREALLNDLIKDGLITHRALEVPVDPHPGQRGKPLTPCLFFSVYDEQQVWCMDSEAQRTDTTTPVDDATLLPEAAAEVEENSEKLMPPWSPLMDVAAMASTHLMDVAGCVTKHLHASMPNASFNALLRADLRQTPGELQGKPFQSYVFLGTSVEAPCPPMVDAATLVENPRQVAALFRRDGLVRVKHILPQKIAEAVCNRVHQELQTRRAEGDGKYFGDVYGYEDTGQRWDLKLQLSSEVKQALTLMLQHVQGVLESLRPSWQLTELAAMCTFPEDPGQPVHADTSHVYDQQVVTIFVALHDISPERGPTKMYPKSHMDGELHLGIKEVDESSAVLCTMSCGDCVLMDSRLLHCGTANTSDLPLGAKTWPTSWLTEAGPWRPWRPWHRFLFYSSWMPPARRSRGSTNTILPEYEDGLSLRDWQQWTS